MAGEVVVSAAMCFLDSSTKSLDCTGGHTDSSEALVDLPRDAHDEGLLSSTHTVVASEEFRDPSLLGLNGVPVSGQGRCGIGVNFVMLDDGAMIVSVKEGGATALDGRVQPGMKLTAVDSKCCVGKSLSELVLWLTGDVGTVCVLDLFDPDTKKSERVHISRGVVPSGDSINPTQHHLKLETVDLPLSFKSGSTPSSP